MEPKKYPINGKTYVQKPLVLGQWEQMIPMMDKFNFKDFTAKGIISEMGSAIYDAVAIVLNPEGVKIKDKDLTSLAEEFSEEMPLVTLMEVIEDFFLYNSVSSLISRFNNLTDLLIENIKELLTKTHPGSKKSSESSAAETSQSEAG